MGFDMKRRIIQIEVSSKQELILLSLGAILRDVWNLLSKYNYPDETINDTNQLHDYNMDILANNKLLSYLLDNFPRDVIKFLIKQVTIARRQFSNKNLNYDYGFWEKKLCQDCLCFLSIPKSCVSITDGRIILFENMLLWDTSNSKKINADVATHISIFYDIHRKRWYAALL